MHSTFLVLNYLHSLYSTIIFGTSYTCKVFIISTTLETAHPKTFMGLSGNPEFGPWGVQKGLLGTLHLLQHSSPLLAELAPLQHSALATAGILKLNQQFLGVRSQLFCTQASLQMLHYLHTLRCSGYLSYSPIPIINQVHLRYEIYNKKIVVSYLMFLFTLG